MAKGYHHVIRDIRSQICAYKASGWSMRRIAKQLGFDVSSISREIKRNSGKRGYRLNQADIKGIERPKIAERKRRIGDWGGETIISTSRSHDDF